ncbi:UNVERIFIED_CONTAM: hypothetical protein Slati_3646300 [Sesamum latifolium]|uniref:Uncharacterized protein n=1 Tax=Sesamum latifolium TaxID=2727402 RepID=A0AAW2U4D8_9LAMI
MQQVYVVPNQHIRYAVMEAFFRAKLVEGSFVQEQGVKMLSNMEKLKNLEADFVKETYINMIMQSLSPFFNPFIINYNMNKLDKDFHVLINMFVQYETMSEKSALSVLVGETSTSKAKGKVIGCWKRKKAKTLSTADSSSSIPIAPKGGGIGKRKRVCNYSYLRMVCR